MCHRTMKTNRGTRRGLHGLAILLVGTLLGLAYRPPAAASVVCRVCGAESPDEAFYCHACGRSIAPQETIFCWRCGLELPAAAEFCTRCGRAVCVVSSMEIEDVSTPVPAETTLIAVGIAESPASPPPVLADITNPVATFMAPQPEVEAEPPVALSRFAAAMQRSDTIFPPRLFDLPTGTILPSLAVHANRGWTFGLSDQEDARRWVLSVGLGGVGEAIVSSSRMIHVVEPQSNALGGFRLRLPVHWLGEDAGRHLSMAVNIAATTKNDFTSSRSFASPDGATVNSLSYEHRETTLGVSATWDAEPARLHVILHATDLRAENLRYRSGTSSYATTPDQQVTYLNLGLGVDYAARENTRLMAEIRTAPRLSFTAGTGALEVERRFECAVGLRFFPIRALGFDALASVDEDASGLADLEIGAGMHLMVGGE